METLSGVSTNAKYSGVKQKSGLNEDLKAMTMKGEKSYSNILYRVKFTGLWHVPNPTNVAVQTGRMSQSSWVSGLQLSLTVLIPGRISQCIPSTFLALSDVGLHTAVWVGPRNGITILCGVISTGHSCVESVEHRARRKR